MAFDNYLVVEAYAEFASYRIPEYHNFHKTLPMPPPTTIIGIAGAAFGLSPVDSQKWFDTNPIELGVYCKHSGVFTDLWKIKSTKADTDSSIIKREFTFRNTLFFAFGSTQQNIQNLREAFLYNCFALTAGNSDSLMKVRNLYLYTNEARDVDSSFEHCLLFGSYGASLKITINNLEANKVYRYNTLSGPKVFNLPYAFDYSDDGSRAIRKRKEMTFVGSRVEIQDGIQIPVLKHQGIVIPMFSYNDYGIPG